MISGINDITHIAGNEVMKSRLNEVLSGLGFKRVLYDKPFSAARNFYKTLTISIYPQIDEDGYGFEKLQISGLPGYIGYHNYMRKFISRDVTRDFNIPSGTSQVVVGRYYKERNLVLFNYAMFNNIDCRANAPMNAFEFLLELIVKMCQEKKIEEIEQTMSEQMIMIEEFTRQFKNRLGSIDRDISAKTNDIKAYSERIVEYTRAISMYQEEKITVSEFLNNSKSRLEQEFNDIKTLPFVKSVKIEEGEIVVNVGNISIEINNQSVPIGDFSFYISSQVIRADCNPRKRVWVNGSFIELIHPHVAGTETEHICFGNERKDIILELLAGFQMKKLVYMLYLWVKSYNPNDKYHAIGYWTGENNMGLSPEEIERRAREARGEPQPESQIDTMMNAANHIEEQRDTIMLAPQWDIEEDENGRR